MNRCSRTGEYGKYVTYRKQDCVVNKYNLVNCKELVRDSIFDWPAFTTKYNGNWPEEFKVIETIVNVVTDNIDLDGQSVVISESTEEEESTVVSDVVTDNVTINENGTTTETRTETIITEVDGELVETVEKDVTVTIPDVGVIEMKKEITTEDVEPGFGG